MTYTIGVFIALHIALIFSILLTGYIIKVKNKKQIHYAYLLNSTLMGIWSLGGLLDNYSLLITGNYSINFFKIGSIGLFFIPVSLLITSRIFLLGKIKLNYKYKLLFVVPVISFLMLLTNEWHNLYYEVFSIYNYETVYGSYFSVHAIYSYICVVIALFNFIVATVRNSGVFSKQAILIFVSSAIPLIVNVLFTYKVLPLTMYITCVAFSFTIVCTYFAILKYGFLDISPISVKKVMDSISDAFIIIDTNYKILDYNATFFNYFGSTYKFNLKDDFLNKLKTGKEIDANKVNDYIFETMQSKKKKKLSTYINSLDKHFEVEFIPITSNDEYLATSILLKDITEHIKDLELIQKTQETLMERERIASLGELAGGMAHDINTPMATIMMGLDFFEGQYDYTEKELKMFKAMRASGEKITDIIQSVRNQIRNMGTEEKVEFYLSDVIKDLTLLLENELKKNKCKLSVSEHQDIKLIGDKGKLGQILMNFVMNSIQAYGENGGVIELQTYTEESNVVIKIEDNAGGIPKKIADGLFKEILTTKGTKGTGFGLYFAHSMLKGSFEGNIEFETEEGVGSTFYLKIPV